MNNGHHHYDLEPRSSLRRLENPVQISPEREWPTACTTPLNGLQLQGADPFQYLHPFPYRGEAPVKGKGKLSMSSLLSRPCDPGLKHSVNLPEDVGHSSVREQGHFQGIFDRPGHRIFATQGVCRERKILTHEHTHACLKFKCVCVNTHARPLSQRPTLKIQDAHIHTHTSYVHGSYHGHIHNVPQRVHTLTQAQKHVCTCVHAHTQQECVQGTCRPTQTGSHKHVHKANFLVLDSSLEHSGFLQVPPFLLPASHHNHSTPHFPNPWQSTQELPKNGADAIASRRPRCTAPFPPCSAGSPP